MSNSSNDSSTEAMQEEYDFSDGVRGKYADRFEKGTNIAVLDPDVAAVFPDSASVNDALRALVKIARRDRLREAESSKNCG
jgi:hypothetical protein